MSEIYSQGDTYYPFFTEPDASLTSVALLIIRDDGFYLDFNDLTFKDSAWTSKTLALTEKTEGVWIWTTGWVIPSAFRSYRTLFKDNAGNTYEGKPSRSNCRRTLPICP